MSALIEIQEAITRLRENERRALTAWLNSQTIPEMTSEDEQRLLHSLDDAMRDVDAGKGVSLEDARKLVASWAAR